MFVHFVNKRSATVKTTAARGAHLLAEKGSESGDVVTSALLLYTGKKEEIADYDIDDALLEQIFNNTLELQKTRRIKIYNDHVHHQQNVVGIIEGELSLRAITAEDVPDFGDFSYLVGRKGIFAEGVRLTDEDACKQYRSETAKEVSVGLGTAPDSEVGHLGTAIHELSLVGMNALAGAHLKSSGITIAEVQSDIEQEERATEERWDAESAFHRALFNINEMEDDDLPEGKTRDELKAELIDEFASALRSALLNQSTDKQTTPGVSTMPVFLKALGVDGDGTVTLDMTKLAELQVPDNMEPAFKALLEESRDLVQATRPSETELAAKKELQDLRVTTAYESNRRKADALVANGQMPPAVHKSLFGEKSEDEGAALKSFKGLVAPEEGTPKSPVEAVIAAFSLCGKNAFMDKVERDEVDDSEGGEGTQDGLGGSFLEGRKGREFSRL